MPTASQYNERRDSLIGFCGKRGDDHICDPNHCIILGDTDDVFTVIEGHHRELQHAGYLRLVVVNPLHEKLPALAVMAHATCNRFTSAWIRKEWQSMEALAEKHLSPKLGVFKGHGSDGDARRFAEMRRRMGVSPSSKGRFGLEAPGFTQSGKLRADGTPECIDSQDVLHNIAKLYSHLSNASRVVKLGNETATHQHVRTVVSMFTREEHGLNAADIDRSDRQNKAAPANCCTPKVRECMDALIAGEIEGVDPQSMKGTRAYLELTSRYAVMYLGEKATLAERVQHASFVAMLLRLARQSVHHTKGRTLAEHFIPKQTYEHVLSSCFNLVLTMMAQREVNAKQPVCLRKCGSDCCESHFSELGGFGRVAGKRNYTVGDAQEGLGDLAGLVLYAHVPDADNVLLHYGKIKHGRDVDIRRHEDASREPADMGSHLDDAALKAAWLCGMEEAKERARELGISPRDPWFQAPWQDEDEQVRDQMYEAGADEIDTVDAVTAQGDKLTPDFAAAAVAANLTDVELGREEEATETATDAGSDDGASHAAQAAVDAALSEVPRQARRAPPPPPEPRHDPFAAAQGEDAGMSAGLDDADARGFEAAIERLAAEEGDVGAGAAPRPKHLPTLRLPSGKLGYKRTVVAEFNKVRQGESLPRDRLARIANAGRIAKDNEARRVTALYGRTTRRAEADAARATPTPAAAAEAAPSNAPTIDGAEADIPILKVGSDFAMAFNMGAQNADKFVWWLGRVEMVYRLTSGGWTLLDRPAIPLDDLNRLKDIFVVATWYSPSPKRRTFKHNNAVESSDLRYSLEHYIGSPQLQYKPEKSHYILLNADRQLAALDAALSNTVPSSHGRTVGEQREALERQQERERAPWIAAPDEERQRQEAAKAERAARASAASTSDARAAARLEQEAKRAAQLEAKRAAREQAPAPQTVVASMEDILSTFSFDGGTSASEAATATDAVSRRAVSSGVAPMAVDSNEMHVDVSEAAVGSKEAGDSTGSDAAGTSAGGEGAGAEAASSAHREAAGAVSEDEELHGEAADSSDPTDDGPFGSVSADESLDTAVSEEVAAWCLQSVTWKENSCHVDAALAFVEAIAYALRHRGLHMRPFEAGLNAGGVPFDLSAARQWLVCRAQLRDGRCKTLAEAQLCHQELTAHRDALRQQLLRREAVVPPKVDAERATAQYVRDKQDKLGTCSERVQALTVEWGTGADAVFLLPRPRFMCACGWASSIPRWRRSAIILDAAQMTLSRDPFEALDRSIAPRACPKCSAQLRVDMSKRPPGASWTEAKDAPPLLMLELDQQSNEACGGAVLSTAVQTLHLRSARRIVELHFRLAAALVMKPQHYATCLRDQESGQWIHFDGMVPWEDLGGVPSGRGSVIDAPRRASDVGGQFWSMLLYERVVAPA